MTPDVQDFLFSLGLFGAGVQSAPVVGEVEGLFGVSLGKDVNAVYQIYNKFGQQVKGVTITTTWAGGSTLILNYDPTVLYDDKLPNNTPLTITVSGGSQYFDKSFVASIPTNGFANLIAELEFKESYVRITKKRYL
jgi:hypothetical protein